MPRRGAQAQQDRVDYVCIPNNVCYLALVMRGRAHPVAFLSPHIGMHKELNHTGLAANMVLLAQWHA